MYPHILKLLTGIGNRLSRPSAIIPAPCTGALYKTDGTVETVTPADGKKFTAEEQSKFVGGGRETVDMGEGWIMVWNENGLNGKLPP
jgi:hypothetical protein